MHHYPKHLVKLIENLKKFPGVGQKSAERFAFHLIEWTEKELSEFSHVLKNLKKELKTCETCGCLERDQGCLFCENNGKNRHLMCVVSHFKDVFAIEETHVYKGLYHVLGGVLSPLEGKGPEHLTIDRLKQRIQDLSVTELVIAIDSTLEGDATALYLKQELENLEIQVSRLAFGLPLGSSLDYVDGGTLAKALVGRRGF
ncbi:MAG: Recombination protein RecR [Chlamydiae bacterium]|nr:Recombination protein RecR [Chlamydiota bacterium]